LGSRAGERADAIRGELRYLAVTYRSRAVSAAPRHFLSPLGTHKLTYAQAHVYNPTAFDTFTQDWRVTLEPASLIEEGIVGDSLRDGSSMSDLPGAGVEGFDAAGGLFDQLNVLSPFNNH